MNSPLFPVIDAHVHLYPDSLASKVTPSLSARFGNAPAFDGTVDGCRANAFAAGLTASLNLPVATTPHQVAHTNSWAKAVNDSAHEAKRGEAPRVYSLAALHPRSDDRAAELEKIAAAGFAGVKFHPEYQEFRFNDAALDEVWETMGDLGLVAFLHAGGERVFKPPFHSTPTEIRDLHRRFPRLKIVAAHLGGFEMWDESEAVLCGEDVWLDLSHTFFWMDDAQILRMIRKHGAGRILFGTDAPWQEPAKVLAALMKLPLSEQEFAAICAANACELFNIPAGEV